MDIFYKNKVNAGTLAVFSLPSIRGQANLFFFNHPAPKGNTFVPGVVISSIQYGQATATQFQRSLDNTIYVYSFGDEMGNLNISGVAFPRTCEGANGLREIMEFYRNNRVSRSVDRVRVTFADETIEGFLSAMSITTTDVSSGVHGFQMLLRSVPLAFNRKKDTGSKSKIGNAKTTASTSDPRFSESTRGPWSESVNRNAASHFNGEAVRQVYGQGNLEGKALIRHIEAGASNRR